MQQERHHSSDSECESVVRITTSETEVTKSVRALRTIQSLTMIVWPRLLLQMVNTMFVKNLNYPHAPLNCLLPTLNHIHLNEPLRFTLLIIVLRFAIF